MKQIRISNSVFLFVVCGVLSVFRSSTVRGADEWPQFRGPNGDGHAAATGLPLRWSESQNVVWKTAIPGRGHSSPVISDDQVWLTTAIETKLTADELKAKLAKIRNSNGLKIAGSLSLRAICLQRDSGQVLHDVEIFQISDPGPIHALNSYASPSPIIEKGRLYCHFGTFGTACLETKTGQIEWSNRDLKTDHQNGPGSSPVLWGDLLIVNYDGIDSQYVAAFDKGTGKVVWKTKRSGELNPRVELQKAYCTPIVIDDGKRVQLISPGADWVYSYNPADGKEIWRAHYGKLGFSTVPRPVVGHGMVYVCTSYMQSRLLAVRYDGTGDVTKSHITWNSDSQIPKKPSTLLVGDELYLVSDGGVATCVDAKTGKQHWRARLAGQYSASPLYADGRIYFFSQEGKTVVIAPGKVYQELATNQLDAGFMASPAVAGKSLYLRTHTHMYRIEDSKK